MFFQFYGFPCYHILSLVKKVFV
ncbi:SWIM zinc finger family protein [Ruminococcus bromii]